MVTEIKPSLVQDSVQTADQIIRGVVNGKVRLDEERTREVVHAVALIKGGFLGILPSRKARILERRISEEIL